MSVQSVGTEANVEHVRAENMPFACFLMDCEEFWRKVKEGMELVEVALEEQDHPNRGCSAMEEAGDFPLLKISTLRSAPWNSGAKVCNPDDVEKHVERSFGASC